MATSKMKMFRIIGESAAQTMGNVMKPAYFQQVSEQLYPENIHRRQWAYDNMCMFYNEECSRIRMMDRLTRV